MHEDGAEEHDVDPTYQQVWRDVREFYQERKGSKRWEALLRDIENIKATVPPAPPDEDERRPPKTGRRADD